MKKSIVLTNEQAIYLYNYLSSVELDDSKNRNRWKFLKVIKNKVFDYQKKVDKKKQEISELQLSITGEGFGKLPSEQRQELQKKVNLAQDKINDEIQELSEQTETFVFNDREAFAESEKFLDMIPNADKLKGYDSEKYYEIKVAFMDVVTTDDTKK